MDVVYHRMRLSFVHKSVSIWSNASFVESSGMLVLDSRKQQARYAHFRRNVSYSATDVEVPGKIESPTRVEMVRRLYPLSLLPFAHLIRSYLITTVSTSPPLLRTSLGVLRLLAHSKSPILNPDRNPVLHFLLKRTVYAQFCAGETAAEVNRTIDRLKGMGYKGVILGYAREICMDEKDAKDASKRANEAKSNVHEISKWAQGNSATVNMAQEGDFVALKFTGAGKQALQHLTEKKPMPLQIEKAVTEVCELAKVKRVRLLFDAEQDAVQTGIDAWTVEYMKRYNKENALVYGTYQAYKKSTPSTLAKHLDLALKEDFVLGVKLVRGAYLGSDPRHLFWDTIEDTHRTYDGIAESLMRKAYNEVLKPISSTANVFPSINLVLASHNKDSVIKAQTLRNSQLSSGEPRIDLAYGQLMGMADNVSCGLVHAGQITRQNGHEGVADIPKTYQYLVWGTVGECSQYLVRRAEENQDAVTRTKDARKALGKELLRRLGISTKMS